MNHMKGADDKVHLKLTPTFKAFSGIKRKNSKLFNCLR